MADFSIDAGPSNMYRLDNERAITIAGDVVKDVTTPIKATSEALAGIDVDGDWPGMRVVVGGKAEESTEPMGSLIVAFVAASVGIYLLLLLLLFNSMIQPLMVMVAIPFGMVGVIMAFADDVGHIANRIRGRN